MNIEHHSLPSEGALVGTVGCGPIGVSPILTPHPNLILSMLRGQLALLVSWGFYIHSVKVGALRAWIC